jgi:Skp family chaperone for outer membrane proteins
MIRVLAVLVVAVLPLVSFAEVKIGYIDSGRIFQEYKGMESITKQFSEEQTEWQLTAEEMLRELETLKSELENQRLMLTDEALAAKEGEIRAKQSEYEAFLQQVWGPDGQAARKNVELTKPVVDKINSVLEDMAVEEGFTMIFDIAEGSVVYAKDGLDLTDIVLEELNREFAPAAELEETKVVIFRFTENTLAEEGNWGDRVHRPVYDLMDRSAQFETIQEYVVENQLIQMGLEREKSIPEELAIEIAKNVGAKVILMGEVNKQPDKVDVIARLIDTDSGEELHRESQTAEGETEDAFQAMISNLVAAIIQSHNR